MNKKFSIAISLSVTAVLLLTSLALAADPPADVLFTTDLPMDILTGKLCSVIVSAISYTDPAKQPGPIVSGSTPWTLPTYPGTPVEFSYPPSADCNGTTYNWVSTSPGNPVTSGAAGAPPTTVTGHYAVLDTTAPTLHLPGDMTAEATASTGATVNFSATADDVNPVHPVVTCNPPSGSTFPLDITTTVDCSAKDAANNPANGSFKVTVVDTTPPTIAPHGDETVEATGTPGTIVNYTAPATSDAVDGMGTASCLPASGSTFVPGDTTVTCNKTDSHGNVATATTFVVHVVDTTPPTVEVPADITVEATGISGAVVAFSASASDLVDGVLTPTCSPGSGSTFPLGTTTVTCSATDSQNKTGSASFTVTVVDTTPPTLNLPADIIVTALDASGAVVSFVVSANDQVDGPVAVTCLPASGSLFLVGTTTVNCTAADTHGNNGSGSFGVTVVLDTTPPVLTLPSNMTVPALNASGAPASFTASANDAVDGPVDVTCSPSSGSWFPIGVSTVNCSAIDSHGNMASGNFSVSVQYAAAGNDCRGVPGHEILQPINPDGSSVFNAGSTVPAKFRVCGSDGNAIGGAGVVTNFRLIQSISDGVKSIVDEPVLSTPSFEVFRSGNGQWIFNIDTKDLSTGNTYVYLISLNDGSVIQFQFDLK